MLQYVCIAAAIAASLRTIPAATLVVTNSSDTPSAGTVTLREAVAMSQPGDVITFDIEGPIYLDRGEIEIVHDLELRGPTHALMQIERPIYPEPEFAFRLFNIKAGGVRFSNLALVGGWIRQPDAQPGINGADAKGGAVFNEAALTVVGCLFKRNSVAAGRGSAGEVGSAGGVAEGGAIYNRGNLVVRNSAFEMNSAVGGSGGYSRAGGFGAGDASGGALFNEGRTELFSCTFFSNSVFGGAGGSAYDPHPGSKGGAGRGAAISNHGDIEIVNVTIWSNGVQAGHGGFESLPRGQSGPGGDAQGGGLFSAAGSGVRTALRNTLIAANRIAAGSPGKQPGAAIGVNVAGVVESRGYNLIADATDSGGWQGSDLLGTSSQPIDPRLRRAAHNNGGLTATIGLRPDSPAIDAGSVSSAQTDQRGLARTFDDPAAENAPGGEGTDIGAFELQPAAPTSLANLSARGRVNGSDGPLIGGVIISGNGPRKILFRGKGNFGLPEFFQDNLYDAVLELYNSEGRLIAQNDNWDEAQAQEIRALPLTSLQPQDAAILITLDPGVYTAVVRGKAGKSGIALVEAYGISPGPESYLGNLGVRADVGRDFNVLIDGFILAGGGGGKTRVFIRALGPSLADRGVVPLVDPTLALHDEYGNVIAFNNDWKETQQEAIEATGIPPATDLESAIVADLPPGPYTAAIVGNNGTVGVSVAEIYNLDD